MRQAVDCLRWWVPALSCLWGWHHGITDVGVCEALDFGADQTLFLFQRRFSTELLLILIGDNLGCFLRKVGAAYRSLQLGFLFLEVETRLLSFNGFLWGGGGSIGHLMTG